MENSIDRDAASRQGPIGKQIARAGTWNGLAVFLIALVASQLSAATTISASNQLGYGANIGWWNWAGERTNGAVIGEYVCSGHIWSANAGWIHLGDGTPTNGIRYQNNSAADFGINHDGVGNLRGYAYSANTGWINFESNGAPKLDLKNGRLSGAVWSANCGWISLSNAVAFVQTDTIQPGADTDGDGIADAWELTFTNTLVAFNASTDTDRDGASDLNEYLADTNPLDPNDRLRVTSYRVSFGGGNETNTATWTVKPTRCYQLDYRTNLNAATPWLNATIVLSPDPGTNMTRMVTFNPSQPQRYMRVRALKPLSP